MGPTLEAQQKFFYGFFLALPAYPEGTAAARGPGFVRQRWAKFSRITNCREIWSTPTAEHEPHKTWDEHVQKRVLAS